MFRAKKGIELSMTVIVLLIISIIIFIGGITLLWKVFGGAETIKQGLDQQTQTQIQSLLREGNDIVAIPINTLQVVPGKPALFGLGIRNIKPQPKTFSVLLGSAGVYDRQGKPIASSKEYLEENWLGNFKTIGNINLAHNQDVTIPLHVRTTPYIDSYDNRPPKGSLVVFNVCVLEDTELPPPEAVCDAKNPAAYGGVHQIFVEIK